MSAVEDVRQAEHPGSDAAEAQSLALVGRQPVYNAAMGIMAYELLYRHSPAAVRAEVSDPRRATLRVIANAALEIGLDRLAGGLPVHVNFPRELLIDELLLLLHPERVVIEVLEDVPADAEVLRAIETLRSRGHRIALDDYSPQECDPALLELADIVKIVIGCHGPDELARVVAQLRRRGVALIAEEVETLEQFERCVALGFDGFQGYFLQHPETFRVHRVPSNRLAILRLLAELQHEEHSLDDIERLVSQDVSLCDRLLRCINSSYYNPPRRIDSIRHAIVMLGVEQLRQLCTMVSLLGFEDRPAGLLGSALVRARMCEQLGQLAGRREVGAHFITGLFSLLDVLLGLPLEEALCELPLAAPVVRALVAGEGDLGAALRCARAYERGCWEEVDYAELPAESVGSAYLEAVRWADSARALMRA